MRTVFNGSNRIAKTKIKSRRNFKNNKDQCRKKKQCLQPIGPDNGFDAAFMTVHPYNQNNSDDGNHKRDTPCIKNHRLKNKRHQIKPSSSSHYLRYQKKPSSRFIGFGTITLIEITVNGSQIEFVIQGKQNIRNDKVPEEKAENHLHIGHIQVPNHSGYRYESNSGNGSANHGKSHHIPFGLLIGTKKSLVIGTFSTR